MKHTLRDSAIISAGVLLLSLSLLGLTACKTKADPGHVVSAAIDSVRSFDIDEMTENWGEAFENLSPDDRISRKICSGINYDIVSVTETSDSAVVRVRISNTDMTSVSTDLMAELCPVLSDDAFRPADRRLTSAELSKLADKSLGELLCREGNPRRTAEADVFLTRCGGEWVIDGGNSGAVQAMLGGIGSLACLRTDLSSQLETLRGSLYTDLCMY